MILEIHFRKPLPGVGAGKHTIIGYLLSMNGDASFARSGWLVIIRAAKPD